MGSCCVGGGAAEGLEKGRATRDTVGAAGVEGRVLVDAGAGPESRLGPICPELVCRTDSSLLGSRVRPPSETCE